MLKSKILLAVTAVSLVALSIGCAVPASTPAGDNSSATKTPVAVENPPAQDVNFRFLVSDEENAIGDFEHLYVTISSIGIQQGGEDAWLEFAPEVAEFDLKPLVGENAVAVWEGSLTPGTYHKIFIYVDTVTGTLVGAAEGETVDLKLPSGKLQISKPFTVTEDEVTSFVYDISVVETGNGKYILKPQIAQSGDDQPFDEVEPDEDNIIEAVITAIDGDIWTVTVDDVEKTVDVSGAEIVGEPVAGSTVEIEGTEEEGIITAVKVEVVEPEQEQEQEHNNGDIETISVSYDDFVASPDIQEELRIKEGKTFQIILSSNPSTGFSWTENATIGDAIIVAQTSHEYVAPEDTSVVGAPGTEVWTFTALQKGETTISMIYVQAGSTEPEWTFELSLTVN